MEENIKYSEAWEKEFNEVLLKAQAGDRYAKEYAVSQNIGLVKSVASKFFNSGYEWEDIYQIGCIGLVKAIERFDKSYNVRFSTYAVPLIIGEIKRFFRDDGRIKVSRDIKTGIYKLKEAESILQKKLGRNPKISEISHYLEMDKEEIVELMEAKATLSSIESMDDIDRKDIFFQEPKIDDEEKKVGLMDIKRALGKLKERDRQIIVLRYFKDMTQQEVADLMQISQVQVSRLEKKILESMKRDI
ncbi:MAG: sigma-70 family RNA polymerase sigma factor [Peptostreptococcales bacterium]